MAAAHYRWALESSDNMFTTLFSRACQVQLQCQPVNTVRHSWTVTENYCPINIAPVSSHSSAARHVADDQCWYNSTGLANGLPWHSPHWPHLKSHSWTTRQWGPSGSSAVTKPSTKCSQACKALSRRLLILSDSAVTPDVCSCLQPCHSRHCCCCTMYLSS